MEPINLINTEVPSTQTEANEGLKLILIGIAVLVLLYLISEYFKNQNDD